MEVTQEISSCSNVKFDSLRDLYELCFPVVARFVAKNGGSFDDAQDIFQDALVIYHEKLSNTLTLKETEEAYIFGISKHLWMRKFKKECKLVSLSDWEKVLKSLMIIFLQ